MIEAMIDDALLESYAEAFYGYGSYGGRYWFVGLEEGRGSQAGTAFVLTKHPASYGITRDYFSTAGRLGGQDPG